MELHFSNWELVKTITVYSIIITSYFIIHNGKQISIKLLQLN